MKRRTLTEDEKRLWEHVTQHDQKLEPGMKAHVPQATEAGPIRLVPQTYQEMGRDMLAAYAGEMSAALPCGSYAGIDRKTAERFRKGLLPMEGTIDLHGMSREKAHKVLSGFLKARYECGSRCLLAITGKGMRKDMQADAAQDIVRGVLREMVPQWLAEPGLRSMVLAFDVAQPKHGGSGAFYILLRRKRVTDARA
jgi:DNA-nicking Smr family endonuclease